MLEAHGTTASLFRYYANTALSYLIDGNSLLGRRLLEISLELYPEYDFALDQLDRVRRGEYDYYIEAKLAERYRHDVDKNSFRRLTKKHRTADAVAVKTWGIDPDKREVDIAEALLVEANRRWSADQPWPDTLTSVAFELNSEARPSVEGERKNLRKAQLLFQELGQLMPAADNRAIRDWIGERMTITNIIVSIAKELPLDNLALGVLADELPDAMVRQKEKAYLLALAAIDRRHEKGLRTYQPYSRTSLQEDYLWILDGLCGVYEASGQEDRAEGIMSDYTQTVTEVESGISKKLKVVRNDPCPCGKLKPDGTPVKVQEMSRGRNLGAT
ncbi:unnamed protein product [Sphagnum compactum]